MGATASRDTACMAGMVSARGSRTFPSRTEPITIAVCGAAGQIGYSLLPMIASGAMFGPTQRVTIHMLDLNLPEVMESMRGMEMELQDGNFPLLHRTRYTADDALAFDRADYAILLGAFPRQDGLEKRDIMKKNIMIFKTMARALQKKVKRDCKVLVVGNPAHTNAWICAHFAPELDKRNFFALTRLDQNRAAGQIAHHFEISVSDVRNVVAWGCHAKFPDYEHAVVRGKPLIQALRTPAERNQVHDLFRREMQQRGACIVKARKASSAMSTARAIVDHIHDLHVGTQPGEFVSMGVWSDHGAYGIGSNLIFSVPVICYGGGRYRVHSELRLSDSSQQRLRQVRADIAADRDLVYSLLANAPATPPSAPPTAASPRSPEGEDLLQHQPKSFNDVAE
mmetsp:Transcript_22478/g.50684  ORF Transcript_22478/g.50684 Transcript_22478/m.50684 type:complete len:396 (+) Transcript_22478:69-1256(+)